MCMGGPSTPAPPPPPPPPPKAPKSADPEVKKARADQKRTAALAQGRQTLLGGALTGEATNSAKKTLLGQ